MKFKNKYYLVYNKMNKTDLLNQLIDDKIITPIFSKYATKADLKRIVDDEDTRKHIKKSKDLLPYILAGSRNEKERKQDFKAFIDNDIFLYDKDFERAVLAGTDRNKNDLKNQLRTLGYRGKLHRFNKLQLGELIVKQVKQNINTPTPPISIPAKNTKPSPQPTPLTKVVAPTRKLSKKERNRLRYEKRKQKKKEKQGKKYIKNILIDGQTSKNFIKNLIQNMKMTRGVVSNTYKVDEVKYTIRLLGKQKLIFDNESPIDIMEKLFNGILNKTIRENNLTNDDKIKFYLDSDSIRGAVYTSFLKVSEMNGKLITDRVLKILQSADKIEIDNLKMGFIFVKAPKGGHTSIVTCLEDYYKKKGYKQIKNEDDYCFVYALYCSLQQLALNKGEITETTYKSRMQLRSKKPVMKLYEDAGIEPKMVSINDIPAFENAFNITINIIDFNQNNACIYPLATEEQRETQVYLHLINNHYNCILNINSFFVAETKQQQFCNGCKRVVSLKHKCVSKCNVSICHLCHKSHDHTVNEVKCNDCLRTFENKACYDNHKEKICSRVFICGNCDTFVSLKTKSDTHMCGYSYCSNCKTDKEDGHDCFISKIEEREQEIIRGHFYDYEGYIDEKTGEHIPKSTVVHKVFKNGRETKQTCSEEELHKIIRKIGRDSCKIRGLIFYDYEAYVNENGEHIPNLIIAHKQPKDGDITKHIFRNNDDFCKWLFTDENMSYTAIAHYSKGYDIHHIKKWLYNNEIQIKFKSIDQGLKTMYLRTTKPNLRFIDSFSFFMSPLRELPKTFELTETKKGYFPHFFNKPENFNYVGPIPSKEMYGYSSMKQKEVNAFNIWYKENSDKVFDFDKEFVEYCESDVDVLRQAWNAFTKIFMNLEIRQGVKNMLNPAEYITLASYVQAIYRCYFMPENSINIIKEVNQNTSVAELEYLLHLERNVLNRCVERQKKMGKYFVDGYDTVTNTVYEFNGCYFHGCNKCFDRNRLNRNNSKTMRMLLCDTMKKKAYLEEQGYTVVTKWEHEWKKERKQHIEFLDENKELLRNPNIELRKTFFGGRTEVFDTYAKSTKNKKIAYADFTSLYPSIQALADYPIGVGRYIKEDFGSINDYFGFIYCKVKAPKNLRIPVLPQTKDGKLMFHTKPMIGQWFSEELKLAVKMGYEVEEIYQVYHYDKKGKDLFGDYVRFFSKVKMENSVKDLSDKNKRKIYLENVKGKFPITLDTSRMCYNAGLRFIAKICLNSLWGKFGQRSNMMKTEIIKNDPAKFYSIMFDNQYEVSSVLFLNEKTIEMKYRMNTDDPIDSLNTNIAIASTTTAWARVWLYNAFLTVGLENVLYCDTDSLIYYHNSNKNPIKTDSTLGGLTDELEGEGYIDELVALAPKTYAYKTSDGKLEVKAKGFSLNKVVSEQINFESMRSIVLNDSKDETVISYPNRIRLDAKTKTLKNVDETKTFKYNYTKRCVDELNNDKTRITTTAY